MTIIAMKDGTNINSNHVVQWARLRNGQTRILLSTGGEQCGETYTDVDDVFIPVIPANPGFVAVFAERWKDGSFHYKRRSVIAWQRCPSGNYAIFEGYISDSDSSYEVIIDPDGGVYDSDKNLYSTLEEWREEYEAEANALAARMAEAA